MDHNISLRDEQILKMKWFDNMSNQAITDKTSWSRSTIARTAIKHADHKESLMQKWADNPSTISTDVTVKDDAPDNGDQAMARNQSRTITVAAEMIKRLYGVMYLTTQSVQSLNLGTEAIPQLKTMFNESLAVLAIDYPQLKDFEYDLKVAETTGNYVFVGTNDISSGILNFMQQAVAAPVALKHDTI